MGARFFRFHSFYHSESKAARTVFYNNIFFKKNRALMLHGVHFSKIEIYNIFTKKYQYFIFLLTSNAKRSFFVVSNHDFSTFGPLSEKATCHFHSRGVEKMKKAVSALGGKHFFLSLPCSMGMPFLFFQHLCSQNACFLFFPTPLQPKCFFLSFSCRVRDACFGFFNTSAAKMLVLFFTTPLQPKCMFLLILQQFLIILDVF